MDASEDPKGALETLFHRGGVCLEHANLLHHVLQQLGFDSRVCAGNVYSNGWTVSPPLTHRLVVVTLNSGDRYVLDVSANASAC